MKKRLREAFYIGMLDILPLLRDPMMMILLMLTRMWMIRLMVGSWSLRKRVIWIIVLAARLRGTQFFDVDRQLDIFGRQMDYYIPKRPLDYPATTSARQ